MERCQTNVRTRISDQNAALKAVIRYPCKLKLTIGFTAIQRHDSAVVTLLPIEISLAFVELIVVGSLTKFVNRFGV